MVHAVVTNNGMEETAWADSYGIPYKELTGNNGGGWALVIPYEVCGMPNGCEAAAN